jgi:hypothetical protein
MNSVDLSLNHSAFIALLPHIEPIFSLRVGAGVDNIQHEFSGVLAVTTLACAMGFEVV